MKAKFSYLLFLPVLLMFALTVPVYSQDEIPGPELNNIKPELNNINSQEPNTEDEKPLLLFESEGRGSRTVLMIKDTVGMRPGIVQGAKSKSAIDAKKKEETDPLNFNFLYYIIQKFKAADLVD